jgi:MFS family permease
MGLMFLLANDVRSVLWWAVVPAVLAVIVLVVFVKEPPGAVAPLERVSLNLFTRLGKACWFVIAIGAALTLARFSEAFLVLRAQSLGIALAMVPIVLVVMNVAYTATAYPAGVAADRGHRKALLVGGLVALIASDLVIAPTASWTLFFAGIVLWGVHMGLTQGLLSTLVADAAPADLRGTAFGVFHVVSGVAMLLASLIAGALWDAYGAAWTFYAGAAFTALALLGLLAVRRSS